MINLQGPGLCWAGGPLAAPGAGFREGPPSTGGPERPRPRSSASAPAGTGSICVTVSGRGRNSGSRAARWLSPSHPKQNIPKAGQKHQACAHGTARDEHETLGNYVQHTAPTQSSSTSIHFLCLLGTAGYKQNTTRGLCPQGLQVTALATVSP